MKMARALGELQIGNARGLETIISFLQRDEYRFRSGYAKELAWRLLTRAPLTERQKERLRTIALEYLRRRMQREFWYMCRFICRIADTQFRSRVEELTKSKDKLIGRRALLLNAYLRSPAEGEQRRREFWSECASSRQWPRIFQRVDADYYYQRSRQGEYDCTPTGGEDADAPASASSAIRRRERRSWQTRTYSSPSRES
jgi:hypothetical protein